ncbi:MAG: 16S rRNA (uracil(1498)-N(3))-methyltransferase [Firmicutes bacterium]|nr:16S rRNA (uracil(1498)-N(3))-methyltransferase [Bacillota bacterium]
MFLNIHGILMLVRFMQRYFSNELNNNTFKLNNDDIYHITKVMRMNENDLIEVVYQKCVYLCNLDFSGSEVSVKLNSKVESVNDESQEIVLIIPLLKEAKMDLILQKATELGVNKIIPVVMERSIVHLDNDRQSKKIERWTKICKEASEQSMRVTIPVITEVKRITDLKSLEGVKLVCSTLEKENTIKMFLQSNKSYDKINIVIGPEGGLSLKEEDYLKSIGFAPVSLGKRIMRVETVPLFILSVLNYEIME